MRTIFINTENSKTNQLLKFVLNLLQRLDLKSLSRCDALQYLSVYYMLEKYDSSMKIINSK